MDKEELLSNLNKLHTTELGVVRIIKNTNLIYDDVIQYCRNIILDKNCYIYKKGKNWYCELNNIRITINSYTYTVITVHVVQCNNV